MKYQQYAHEVEKYVKEIAYELEDPDNIDQANRIMITVLHVLRDLLTPEESLHLISQFPMLIKAVYVNGWHIGPKKRIRNMNEFVEQLRIKNPITALEDFGDDEQAIKRAKAVFIVLRNHISIGEVKDIVSQLPPELTELLLSPEEERERL
jgi:uncharacterized protein (DUF2267 family)